MMNVRDHNKRSMTSAVAVEANNEMSGRVQSCPLCGAQDKFLEFPRVRDRLGFVDGEFDFYRCADCQSVSLLPMPAEDEIPTFYSETYKVDGPPKGRGLRAKLQAIEWLTIFEPVYRAGAKSVLRMTGLESGKLLEIGCSSGYQLVGFARHGDFETYGVDIDRTAVIHARDELGLRVLNRSIQEAQLPESSFDLVILFNVLEHLPKPDDVLREIDRILKPGGYLAIKTQVIDSLQAKALGRRWMVINEAPRHVLLASSEGIKELLNGTGLHLVDQSAGPVIENSIQIALSIFPTATSMLAFERRSLISSYLTRLAGAILTLLAIPFVLVERATGVAGTMIYVAQKGKPLIHQDPGHSDRAKAIAR